MKMKALIGKFRKDNIDRAENYADITNVFGFALDKLEID